MVLANFNRWLKGSFICEVCGRSFHLMTFGYGTGRCPNCFEGEGSFMRLDEGYWLNRLIQKIVVRGSSWFWHVGCTSRTCLVGYFKVYLAFFSGFLLVKKRILILYLNLSFNSLIDRNYVLIYIYDFWFVFWNESLTWEVIVSVKSIYNNCNHNASSFCYKGIYIVSSEFRLRSGLGDLNCLDALTSGFWTPPPHFIRGWHIFLIFMDLVKLEIVF